MAKLNRGEVIERLKQLKEGDVLTAGPGSPWYNEGAKHPVFKDRAGDLYILDKDGDDEYVNCGDDYDYEVVGRVLAGILILPQSTALPEPFFVELASYSIENLTDYTVILNTDRAGFIRLEKLLDESMAALELPKLLAQKAHIEKQIEALTKGAN